MTQTTHPCYGSLSQQIAPIVSNPKAFTYHASLTGSVGGYTTFFAVSPTPTCDPTSCTLYGQGCSTPYATAYPSGKVSIVSSSPWAITVVRNINTFWSEIICLSCTNGFQTIFKDSYTIVQSNNPCYNSLSLKATFGVSSPHNIAYSFGSSSSAFLTWTNYITSSVTPTCDPTTCSILA